MTEQPQKEYIITMARIIKARNMLMADGYHNADVLDRMVNLLRSRPAPPPAHPQRCDTCEYYNGGKYFDKCKNDIFPDNMDSTERQYIKDWISSRGCASHSPRTSAPATPDDPIESRFLTKREAWEVGYDDAAGQILIENQLRAKQQNKPPAPSADAVLDELDRWAMAMTSIHNLAEKTDYGWRWAMEQLRDKIKALRVSDQLRQQHPNSKQEAHRDE